MDVDYYLSPLGHIEISANDYYVQKLSFIDCPDKTTKLNSSIIELCKKELELFFSKKLDHFTVPFEQSGTTFQKKVWNAIEKIPYGKTRSYEEIAASIGNDKAAQAVGNAAGANKLLLLVPCHRVLGKTGALAGYVAGVDKKEWLLNHELKTV